MHLFLSSALLILGYVSSVFVLGIVRRDNSVMDIAWGIGFIVVTLFGLSQSAFTERQVLLSVLVVLWGGRLTLHILRRNRGKSEDFRYKEMREKWGDAWLIRSYIDVYLLQGVVMFIVSLPVIWTMMFDRGGLVALDVFGVLVWFIGFACESIADEQLYRFKKNPSNKGKIMTQGIWRYSRHPNYFGEALLWFGVWIISLSAGGAFTVVGPALIAFLVRYVSGVPLLEKKYADNSAFQAYAKKTSIFIPWFPKRN